MTGNVHQRGGGHHHPKRVSRDAQACTPPLPAPLAPPPSAGAARSPGAGFIPYQRSHWLGGLRAANQPRGRRQGAGLALPPLRAASRSCWRRIWDPCKPWPAEQPRVRALGPDPGGHGLGDRHSSPEGPGPGPSIAPEARLPDGEGRLRLQAEEARAPRARERPGARPRWGMCPGSLLGV